MPQLDFTTTFPQIFWLIITFFSLYTILTHFFLPNFIKSLKARKQILVENADYFNYLQSMFDNKQKNLNKIIESNFLSIREMLENKLFLYFQETILVDLKLSDKKIAKALYNSILYYNLHTLDSVPIKPTF